MPTIYRKPHIIIPTLERPISRKRSIPRPRWQKRIPTFGAKEMLFVVGPFTEFRVVEGDEDFVDDGGLAVVATGCELLCSVGCR